MTAGYEKRTRFSNQIPFSSTRLATQVAESAGSFWLSQEEVVSYRDDVKGTRLDPRDVDIYNGFFTRSNSIADYLNPGPKLLGELEAAGLAVRSDYKSLDGYGIDNGHPFYSKKSSIRPSLRGTELQWTGANFTHPTNARIGGPIYHGFATVNSDVAGKMPFPFPEQSGVGTRQLRANAGLALPDLGRLQSDATKAIQLCAPAVPHVSLTASIGELFAGLPLLPGQSLLKGINSAAYGDEYLNLVFGLLPTLSDAKKFSSTMRDLSLKLWQLRRDAGRRVRRSWGYPLEQRAEVFGASELSNVNLYAANSGSLGFKQVTDYGGSSTTGSLGNFSQITQLLMRESRSCWFSGSFTYFLPEIPGLSGRIERYMSEHDRLLGLQMDSNAAWQLSPWSWLIDWFTDISENLAAIQVAHDDNLVMNYGYGMEKTVRSAVLKTSFLTPNPKIAEGAAFVNTAWETTTKRRIRANPYGFVSSADGGAWSPYRMAVLAALGITRA